MFMEKNYMYLDSSKEIQLSFSLTTNILEGMLKTMKENLW